MTPLETDGRRGSVIVLVVLVVVALLLTSVYFREGDEGPLHSSRAVVLSVTRPIATAGEIVANPFKRAGRFVSGLGAPPEELAELEAQNEELRARLAELEEARLENARLHTLVDFVEEQDLDTVGARVISRPRNPWESTLMIDRGSNDGVERGLPVIAAQGVLGQVVDVAPEAATVRLISDRRSGVAALIQATRVNGIVSGSIDGELRLEFVPAQSAPEVGDVAITSGEGGIYPKGLVIGDVVDVSDERGSLFPVIVLESRVPISEIEEALVIRGPLPLTGLGGDE